MELRQNEIPAVGFSHKALTSCSIICGSQESSQLAKIIKDEDDETFLDGYQEELINPITKEKLEYKYQLDFNYDQLNKKTWINRWQQFNPVIKNTFNYDEIKSDIEDINILNKELSNEYQLVLKDEGFKSFGYSFTPISEIMVGMLIRHEECFTITKKLTKRDEQQKIVYKPSCYYVYQT